MANKSKNVRVAAQALQLVPIDQLVPYANNARTHDTRQIAQLRASLREFGFVTPILIDENNNVIAGHGRLEAARQEGMTDIPCVLVTDLTDAQRRAYILADNRLAETSAWDKELLALELDGLQALNFDAGLAGFDAEALEAFALGSKRLETEALDLDDDADEGENQPSAQVYHCPKCGFEFEVNP